MINTAQKMKFSVKDFFIFCVVSESFRLRVFKIQGLFIKNNFLYTGTALLLGDRGLTERYCCRIGTSSKQDFIKYSEYQMLSPRICPADFNPATLTFRQ